MKAIPLILFALLLIACAIPEVDLDTTKEVDELICQDYDFNKSYLANRSLFDFESMYHVENSYERETARDYLIDVRLYLKNHDMISYVTLIEWMTSIRQWGQKTPTIYFILSKSIDYYQSPRIISKYDRCRILYDISKAERIL